MSILGGMVIICEEQDGHKSLHYEYIDMVVENTSEQGARGVYMGVEAMLHTVKNVFTHVQEIFLQSDNASGFASLSHIPFVHFLNQKKLGINLEMTRRERGLHLSTGRPYNETPSYQYGVS